MHSKFDIIGLAMREETYCLYDERYQLFDGRKLFCVREEARSVLVFSFALALRLQQEEDIND
jgi:hypothetical protein